jgi:heme A synthase
LMRVLVRAPLLLLWGKDRERMEDGEAVVLMLRVVRLQQLLGKWRTGQ